MDGISVPSRFACLKIEDEEFHTVSNKSSKKKVENNSASNVINKKVVQVQQDKGGIKKPSLKQNPSGNGFPKNSSKKSKSKAKHEDKQWEDWKRKDDEYVNENFEQDLQNAILQSKIDFENQKSNSVSVIVTSQDKNKKKKSKTMSLDQFLESNKPQKPNKATSKGKENKVEEDEDFFEKAIHSAKQDINREMVEEKRRERNSNIEEVITLVQYQEKLQKQIEMNVQLKEELERARKEITIVKTRNKTLCSMLSQGEMKDKAAVLLELEKLTTVKQELTEEVARLHKLLEQERSSTKANSHNNIGTSEPHTSKHKEKTKTKKKH